MKNDKHSCVEQNKCSVWLLFVFDEVEFIWRGATGKYDNITLLFIQPYVKRTTKALIR